MSTVPAPKPRAPATRMRPTSIRLTAEQEAELAALAVELPRDRPNLAFFARGGILTPGAVLKMAVIRGLAALRRDVGPDDGALDAAPEE